jgi:hypothetical protein
MDINSGVRERLGYVPDPTSVVEMDVSNGHAG